MKEETKQNNTKHNETKVSQKKKKTKMQHINQDWMVVEEKPIHDALVTTGEI